MAGTGSAGYSLLQCGEEVLLEHVAFISLREYIISLGERGTTYKEISRGESEDIIFPYPPLPEQSRIATVLWFDDLIENKKRQNGILGSQ